MSDNELEQIVQDNTHLIYHYLLEDASKHFRAPVSELEITATQTEQKIGASGQILISNLYYKTEYGEYKTLIAFKYFNNEQNAMDEIRNSLELDVKFKTHPHFATPMVLFASTKDPVLIIYEGIDASNYDETDYSGKAILAGKLLASIHTANSKPVYSDIYKGLARMIGQYLAPTGLEKSISQGLGRVYQKIENAMSGCDPFSDFHQSNVMLSINDEKIVKKIYVIDPEFMQKGSFDRLEDVGTFFGKQLLDEFNKKNGINEGLRDITEFLRAYEELNVSNHGLTWKKMYPNGCPLAFFISQWGIMDCIDQSMQLELPMTDPKLMKQLKFVEYILTSDPFIFPQ